MKRLLLSGTAIMGLLSPAGASVTILNSTGASTTVFTVDTAHLGTSGCSTASVECPVAVPLDSTGALFGVVGNPFFVTVGNASLAVTAASLPLPTSAATSTKQSDGTQKTQIVDGSGNVIASASNALKVDGSAVTQPVSSGTLASAANQTTANTSLATIATNSGNPIPAQAGRGVNIGAVEGLALSHASGASASLTSLVVKASAGNLADYNCTAVAGGAAGYCVVYNGTVAPGTGALTAGNVLDYCYIDTTARGCSLSRLPSTIAYSTGIVILVTSAATPYTYTTGVDTAALEADYY